MILKKSPLSPQYLQWILIIFFFNEDLTVNSNYHFNAVQCALQQQTSCFSNGRYWISFYSKHTLLISTPSGFFLLNPVGDWLTGVRAILRNVSRKRSVLMVTEWERCPLATLLMLSPLENQCGEEKHAEWPKQREERRRERTGKKKEWWRPDNW